MQSTRGSRSDLADDCDDAIEQLRGHDVAVLEEPHDQPWGERTATVAALTALGHRWGAPPHSQAPSAPPREEKASAPRRD